MVELRAELWSLLSRLDSKIANTLVNTSLPVFLDTVVSPLSRDVKDWEVMVDELIGLRRLEEGSPLSSPRLL